ncbi:MAG: transglutaminase-like domain-containing protein [Pyrinomonadaceae bacterium]|nr:transglutaminase-like domain-containing protein [Pyrinomonadaceae bacterium]
MKFVFQRDIPIQQSTYYFKPFSSGNFISFNMRDEKPIKDKGGFYKMGLSNVPALREEPYMPPEDEVRSWGVFYYTSRGVGNYVDFWARIGGALVEIYDVKDTLKPGGDSKKIIGEIVGSSTNEDEKLKKIFDYTRKNIKNLSFDTTITDEEKEKIKSNTSPEQTLKRGQGTSDDINDLFATLAIAAGFEARVVFTGDRSELFFSRKYQLASFVHRACVAVKTLQGWRFLDPGYPFMPYGMLAWFEEGQDAILLGTKDYMVTKIPLTGIDRNLAKRTGKFKLLEDGTLEGDVKIEYFGQLAYRNRVSAYEDSQSKREEDLKETIKSRLSTAEVSNISIENLMDVEKPLVHSYKIKVPNYAQKTGKRIFLQPGFFEFGVKPLFTSATRTHDVSFNYPWAERDNIEITLPKDFGLDNADSPGVLADPERVGFLEIAIKANPEQTYIKYDRKFHFANGTLLFPKSIYQPVKGLFDAFNKADTHTITLKQK